MNVDRFSQNQKMRDQNIENNNPDRTVQVESGTQ